MSAVTALNDAQHYPITYPHGEDLPEAGRTLALKPGVKWVRLPLPFMLNHINVWLLRDEIEGRQGWTLVDCGIANDATRALWEQVYATELDGLPVLRVLVTHMHPDHIGLADWHTRRWSNPAHDCRMWISATDYAVARMLVLKPSGFGGEAAAEHFRRHGLSDPEAVAKVRARGNYYGSMVPAVPETYRRLMHGDEIQIGGQAWHCIAGYGHAPEHISLHCEALGVMISGDMLLPRISTNVSVIDSEPEGDPLALFLDSIAALRELPAQTLILPSHGRPFVGLHARIAQLQQHHDERLAEVLLACREAPRSAAELLPVLFRRPLDLHQTTFAMGEAIAHLNCLWAQGLLQREADAEGVWHFRA